VTTKDEATRVEADAWTELEAAVAAVPEERLASREGWAEDPGETDDVNEREFHRSRALPWVEVRAQVDEARARLLDVWAQVVENDAEGLGWFVEETIDHYPEHLPQIRALADDPSVKAKGV
jgi:hypothetical protein